MINPLDAVYSGIQNICCIWIQVDTTCKVICIASYKTIPVI